MPISSFPPELLSAIFSHLHYNKYSLLQLSLTSKTFHRVAKPILYSTVTITFEETVDLVAQFKEDEAKLVRTLVLEGQDPEWDLLDEDALVGRFGTIPFDQWVSDLQGGLVQEIVQGDFLDNNRTFSRLRCLYIRDIIEDPLAISSISSINLKGFSNLVDLTILSHRGGAVIWNSVLRKKNLPSLRTLAIYDVTWIQPGNRLGLTRLDPNYSHLDDPASIGSFMQDHPHLVEVSIVSDILRQTDLLPQLDFLVAPDFDLPSSASHKYKHLSLLLRYTPYNKRIKYARTLFDYHGMAEGVEILFSSLEELIKKRHCSLEYLALCIPCGRKGLPEDWAGILDLAEEKGIEVYDEGVQAGSMVPQSFIDFLKRKKDATELASSKMDE
ncbi:hypothetical protein JCM5350_007060 [Sporobolomyces pararoseus]